MTLPVDTLEIIIPFCDDFRNFYYLQKSGFIKDQIVEIMRNLSEESWNYLARNYKLAEGFMREFQNQLDWEIVTIYQRVSEDFIREFIQRMNKDVICVFQMLSEDFIRENVDEIGFGLDVCLIVAFQEYSEEFDHNVIRKIPCYDAADIETVVNECFVYEIGDIVAAGSETLQKYDRDFARKYKNHIKGRYF